MDSLEKRGGTGGFEIDNWVHRGVLHRVSMIHDVSWIESLGHHVHDSMLRMMMRRAIVIVALYSTRKGTGEVVRSCSVGQ